MLRARDKILSRLVSPLILTGSKRSAANELGKYHNRAVDLEPQTPRPIGVQAGVKILWGRRIILAKITSLTSTNCPTFYMYQKKLPGFLQNLIKVGPTFLESNVSGCLGAPLN